MMKHTMNLIKEIFHFITKNKELWAILLIATAFIYCSAFAIAFFYLVTHLTLYAYEALGFSVIVWCSALFVVFIYS